MVHDDNAPGPTTTRQWILAEYPRERLNVSKDFKLVEVPLYPEEGKPPRSILVKSLWFSNDPAQRTWLTDKPEERMYIPPIRKGDLIRAITIGEVVESSHPDYKCGDLARGMFGWTEYTVVDLDDSASYSHLDLLKIPPKMDPVDFMATGLTALTAYFGLLHVGSPKATDRTLVVSGAAGATGSTVTQIGKNILGIPRVIGIAGSDSKCALIKEKCGVDIALNYKDPNFRREYEKATPNHVDIYFDNVGGEVLDMNLGNLAKWGRIVTCGAVSSYEDREGERKIAISAKGYENMIFMRGRIQGFVVADFQDQFEKAAEDIRTWVREGKLKPLKTVWKAKFEEVPYGMVKLLKGDNVGKFVTEIVA